MNIALAINMKFAKYAYVLLASILENNDNVNIYILYSSLTEEIMDGLEKFVKKYGEKVVFINVGNIFEKFPVMEKWPAEIYYRLLLPYILPDTEARVLYLDTDVVNIKGLKDLYDVDFEGKSLAACQDVSSGRLSEIQGRLFEEFNGRETIYYNSGVLLMNLPKIRERYCLDDFFEFIMKKRELLTAYDQDTINYLFHDDILDLPSDTYNLYARVFYNSGVKKKDIDNANVYIIHFTGPKPWSENNLRTDIELFWWKYAKLTPYYHEFMESLLLGMMENNYTESNEFKYLNHQLIIAQDEIKRVQAKNSELIEIVNECRDMVAKLN